MSIILKGPEVAKAINAETKAKCEILRAKGICPTLAILRVGERSDDIAYEKGAMKRCAQVGVDVKNVVLDEKVSSEEFFAVLNDLNSDSSVHGILLFRPLPAQLDGEKARKMLAPEKDVDGCTDGSLAGVFTGSASGFAPCTAQAAVAILDHYGIDCKGKNVAVIGRSLVIGRPVAMMLMHKNATVTICHTKTKDVKSITKAADIIIAASGQMESVDASYLGSDQVIVDVGIGWNDAKQKLCGDVLFEEAEPLCVAITPVPGGVGSVTTSILVSHVAEAAERTVK